MKIRITIPIWLKISIITTFMFLLLSEFFIQYFENKSITDFKTFSQTSLVDKAKLIASGINGDEHSLAIMDSDSSLIYYDKIRNYLEKTKKAISWQEEIFTVFLHDDRNSCYGVKSNTTYIARKECSFRDSILIPIFKKAFKENKPVYSEIYHDRGNYWLSGFAPFTNNKGIVVAVVELDLNLKEYKTKLADFTSWSNYFRIIGVFLSILLGVILGLFFGRPISTISKGMTRISKQDFSMKQDISIFKRLFPDEIVTLTDTFNQMSDKLNKVLSELINANRKLDELDHSKSVFLNLIAHEMRTPLTGLGFIDYLKKHHSCSKDDEEIIELISESYLRIKLFSSSAEKYIRALNFKINPKAYSKIDESINFSLKEKKSLADEKNIELQYSNSNVNSLVAIEQEILTEILNIILDNAIKFSHPNSKIEIYVNSDSEQLSLVIKDYGIGINPQNLNNIFNLYFVNDINSHSKGSGVNLPIAKILINKYDGDIIAKSDGEDQGSEFILTMKLFKIDMIVNSE